MLVALLVFWRPLTRLLGSAEVTVEVGGQKVTIKQLNDQQSVLVADLQRELARLSHQVAALSGVEPEPVPRQGGQEVADSGIEPPVVHPSVPAPQAVLWVDDNPASNAVLIDRLRREGVRVDLADSTAQGIARLDGNRYAIVVPDMSRVEDKQTVPDAGVRLLRLVRDAYPGQRVVVCTGPGQAFGREARQAGAAAVTSSPLEVLREFRAVGLPV